MEIQRSELEELIFGSVGARRFTQDSPVLPDVWLDFGRREEGVPSDLLLTPHRDASAGELAAAVQERLRFERERRAGGGEALRAPATRLAYSQTAVAVRLVLDEVVRVLLPLSRWWREYVETDADGRTLRPDFGDAAVRRRLARGLARMMEAHEESPAVEALEGDDPDPAWRPRAELLWLVRLVGTLLVVREGARGDTEDGRADGGRTADRHDPRRLAEAFCELLAEPPPEREPDRPILFLVSLNRRAGPTVARSVLSVKADAAIRLFELRCDRLSWAVLDSGIDARHPAFRRRTKDGPHPRAFPPRDDAPDRPANHTRVTATWDFTRVRYLLSPDLDEIGAMVDRLEDRLARDLPEDERRRAEAELRYWTDLGDDPRDLAEAAKRLREGLASGRSIDWSEVAPFLEVRHDEASYRPPLHDHGTHVAGILAADWQADDAVDDHDARADGDVIGMCPDINLFDFRVLDDAGAGDEFSVMAALQFLRWLNANRDTPLIHGANLSLAIPHDVANYACGRTPICEECERVVASGVLVVAAAGNEGYVQYQTPTGATEGYRSISIVDPGNAEAVITVGATHRHHPHTYGVSYFSSRGPTGDGRHKPDLVAPGEKILAPVPRGLQVKDGTSMAAPHVSGAAALLMSRHRELISQPRQVKRVLCSTSTDLGRERYFQGSGMLDVLRALQSV